MVLEKPMNLTALLDSGLSKYKLADQLEPYVLTIAVLICDMPGMTKLFEEEGLATALLTIRRFHMRARDLIEAYGGRVVKFVADDVFAAFPDAESAVKAGTEIARGSGASVGIGYGPVLLVDGDLWGAEVNAASRLGEDVAQHGEVLLTDLAARDLSRSA